MAATRREYAGFYGKTPLSVLFRESVFGPKMKLQELKEKKDEKKEEKDEDQKEINDKS